MTNMDVNRNFLCIRVPRNHSAPAAFVEPQTFSKSEVPENIGTLVA